MDVTTIKVNFTKAAALMDERDLRHAATAIGNPHAAGNRKFFTERQCLSTVRDAYVPAFCPGERSDGKLRSKVVCTKSDTCLIHERRCQHRPAIYHVSGSPCRVRCRGPDLNQLSSTLVQLNQNKFYFSGGGEHDCKRVRKAGSCTFQKA